MDLDIRNLVGGAGVTMEWLVQALATLTPMDRLEVIARARHFLETDE